MKAVIRTRRSPRLAVVIAAATAATLLPAAPQAVANHFANTVELAADSPVETAIAWSQLAFPDGAQEASLGRDDAFPDSLASGVLQAAGPLLLTPTDQLDVATANELERLGVDKVRILGGTAAVSEAVAGQLSQAGYEVVRHSGANRIETAVEVAKAAAAAADTAIVARAFGDGEDESRAFADSLAAGGWSAASGTPVLLTETDKLSDATAAYLQSSSVKEAVVVGGRAAVSDAAAAQLEALGVTVKRVSGATRFDTAIAIAAERGFNSAADAQRVILTEGQAADGWPAGFAAAALSKIDEAPVILANGAELPEPTARFLEGELNDVGLVCSPKVAEEGCDAAAGAMQKTPAAGLIEIALTAVGRYGEVEGTIANPGSVSGLKVSGCGYTSEPVYVYDDGSFFVLVSEQGTCTMSFAIQTSQGAFTESVEITVGEEEAPPSFTVRPEAYQARVVKVDEEGAHIRVLFDEAVGASVRHDYFWLVQVKDFVNDPPDPIGYRDNNPIAAYRDPRSPRAVLVVWPESMFKRATAIAVESGIQKHDSTTAPEAAANPAAVRDAAGYGSPEAYLPLKSQDSTSTLSVRPDLVKVHGFDPATRSVLFEFNRDVDPPASSGAGDAVLVLTDGSVKEADVNGFARGPDDNTLRVFFTAAVLGEDDWTKARRAFVKGGVVPRTGKTEATHKNTPVAVVITGGGLTAGPDFIRYSNITHLTSPDRTTVTLEFDTDLVNHEKADWDSKCGSVEARFVLVKVDGVRLTCEVATVSATDYPSLDGTTKVRVAFGGKIATEDIAYFTVLDGAVKAFAGSQLPARADSIRNLVTKVYAPGETEGADIDRENSKVSRSQSTYGPPTCTSVTLQCGRTDYSVKIRFDEAITGTGDSNAIAPSARLKVYWADGQVKTMCAANANQSCSKDNLSSGAPTTTCTLQETSGSCWTISGGEFTITYRAADGSTTNPGNGFLLDSGSLKAAYVGLSAGYFKESGGVYHTPPVGFGVTG